MAIIHGSVMVNNLSSAVCMAVDEGTISRSLVCATFLFVEFNSLEMDFQKAVQGT